MQLKRVDRNERKTDVHERSPTPRRPFYFNLVLYVPMLLVLAGSS
jgi:hypothetical protein